MSTLSKSHELMNRIVLYVMAVVFGAWMGWHFGLRHEYLAVDRPLATEYASGYALYEAGICTRGIAPFPYPRPCTIFGKVDSLANDPRAELEARQQARSLWVRTQQIAFRWIPGGAVACLLFALFLSRLVGPDGTGWRAKWSLRRKGKWIRGSRLASSRCLAKAARKAWGDGVLQLADVTIPAELEPYHFLMLGSTGRGKTIAILQLLDGVRARGDRAVIADAAGESLARYGFDPNRGDIILNPLDARAVAWSPLAEIRNRVDLALIARALIPDAFGEAGEWHRYAQTFITDVLRRAYAENATNKRIVEMATVTELPRLRKLLANTPAAALSAEDNERLFGSVRSVVTTHITPLMLCHDDAGRDAFSLRRWVAEGRGWAYINYQDGQLAYLKYLVGAMLEILTTAVMELPTKTNDRVWLALDEVASLGRIQSLASFLTGVRKHGGCAILGVQSNAQIRETYGPDGAQVVLSSLSTQLLLAVNDPDTAKYASGLLGDAEYARKVLSGGKSDDGSHQGWNYEYRVSPIVLPSEVSALLPRRGYLRMPGCIEAAQVVLRIPESMESGSDPFVARELPEITLEDFAPSSPDAEASAPARADDLPDFDDDKERRP